MMRETKSVTEVPQAVLDVELTRRQSMYGYQGAGPLPVPACHRRPAAPGGRRQTDAGARRGGGRAARRLAVPRLRVQRRL